MRLFKEVWGIIWHFESVGGDNLAFTAGRLLGVIRFFGLIALAIWYFALFILCMRTSFWKRANFAQARAITDYRRLHGPLHSLDDLRLSKDFPREVIERLTPYVEYSEK